MENEFTGDEWNLRELAWLSADDLWTWSKTGTMGYARHEYLARDKCVNFEREVWFELGKCMWINQWSVYQDYLKYIHNDILKPFRIKIIRYIERVRDMHVLEKYLPQPSMKDVSAEADNWTVSNQ